MRSSKLISVTFGPQQASLAFNEYLRARVQASLADPRPSVPAADVFKRLRGRHARKVRAAKRGA